MADILKGHLIFKASILAMILNLFVTPSFAQQPLIYEGVALVNNVSMCQYDKAIVKIAKRNGHYKLQIQGPYRSASSKGEITQGKISNKILVRSDLNSGDTIISAKFTGEFLSAGKFSGSILAEQYYMDSERENYDSCIISLTAKILNHETSKTEVKTSRPSVVKNLVQNRGDPLETFYEAALKYKNGVGVLQDFEIAYMWFNIAAANGNKDAVKERDDLVNTLSASSIESGQKRAKRCISSDYSDCD